MKGITDDWNCINVNNVMDSTGISMTTKRTTDESLLKVVGEAIINNIQHLLYGNYANHLDIEDASRAAIEAYEANQWRPIDDVNRLADYILSLDCGYPKQGGAIDTAIQMITDFKQENERLRSALNRQCDNMAFVLNRADLHSLHEKFERELRQDREALATEPKTDTKHDWDFRENYTVCRKCDIVTLDTDITDKCEPKETV